MISDAWARCRYSWCRGLLAPRGLRHAEDLMTTVGRAHRWVVISVVTALACASVGCHPDPQVVNVGVKSRALSTYQGSLGAFNGATLDLGHVVPLNRDKHQAYQGVVVVPKDAEVVPSAIRPHFSDRFESTFELTFSAEV